MAFEAFNWRNSETLTIHYSILSLRPLLLSNIPVVYVKRKLFCTQIIFGA